MAYDEELARRIRELLAGDKDVTEMKMFGGLAFLVGGNMAIAASGQGGAMVRVDPADAVRLVETTDPEMMGWGGKSMPGWVRGSGGPIDTKGDLTKWVQRGTGYARSLPAK